MSQQKPVSELRQSMAVLIAPVRKATAFGLISGLLVLAPTYYMFEVYERVVNSRSPTTLLMLTLLLLFLLFIMEWLQHTQTRLLQTAAHRWDELMANRIFAAAHAHRLSHPASMALRPFQDWQTLRDMVSSPAITGLIQLPVAVVFAILLYVLHPALGWVALASAGLQALLTYASARTTAEPMAKARQASSQAKQYADYAQQQAETAEAMGMMPSLLKRWRVYQDTFVQSQATASLRAGGFQAAMKFLQLSVSSALLGLAAWLAMRDSLTGGAGMLVVASVLGGRMLAPLLQLVAQWSQVSTAQEAWTRLDILLEQFPQRLPSMALPEPKGRLTVEGVVAGAPALPGAPPGVPIIRGVQFSLQAGEALAIIGPSASGKSSLTRLLVGLWPCAQGKVRLDGVDVFAWDKSQLGAHVGYLPQQVGLLEGTLGENIERFGPRDEAMLQKAVATAGLQSLVESLPHGLDTQVGPGGAYLSGGQRQRVGLARALYGRSSLLVLDEPNAHLDASGDEALAAALAQAKANGTTVVVISHRLGLLSVCDKVLVLKDGQQQAFGLRDEVMAALKNRTGTRAVAHASVKPVRSPRVALKPADASASRPS